MFLCVKKGNRAFIYFMFLMESRKKNPLLRNGIKDHDFTEGVG